MNPILCYLILSIAISTSIYAKENLLQNGFAAVAVSTDAIEMIYVQSIENTLHPSYAEIGANWDDDGYRGSSLAAGMHVFEDSRILFITDDSFHNMNEIAFENPRERKQKKDAVKLSSSDITEINEALIFSQIKVKSIDPAPFPLHLEEDQE